MASLTRQTWVWASSGSWWRTGKPGVLQSMGSQRVRHDWATELNWMWLKQCSRFTHLFSPPGHSGRWHFLLPFSLGSCSWIFRKKSVNEFYSLFSFLSASSSLRMREKKSEIAEAPGRSSLDSWVSLGEGLPDPYPTARWTQSQPLLF